VIVLAVVAAAAVVALGAGAAAREDAWLVFTASPNHGGQAPQLFRVHASGTGLRQITIGRGPANDPAFAPTVGASPLRVSARGCSSSTSTALLFVG
jgi:hypothetical protein